MKRKKGKQIDREKVKGNTKKKETVKRRENLANNYVNIISYHKRSFALIFA
jgi:hypothetical protein